MIEGTPTQRPFFALFDHIMEKHNLKNDARLYEFFDKKIMVNMPNHFSEMRIESMTATQAS